MYVFSSGRRECMRGLGLGLGFTNPVRTEGVVDVCLCFGCQLGPGSGGVAWCDLCVGCESVFSVYMVFPVYVYCDWRIPAYLRCTQCSILLHLMDICFITCICL